MKCLFALLGVMMICGNVYALDDSALAVFFSGGSFSVNEISLQNSTGNNLKIAYRKAKDSSVIIEKAVLYSEKNGICEAYAYIMGPSIVDADLGIIVDVSKAPGEFYGWKCVEYRDQKNGNTLGLSLTLFSDDGKRTTDAIDMVWNEKSNTFSIKRPDRSQW